MGKLPCRYIILALRVLWAWSMFEIVSVLRATIDLTHYGATVAPLKVAQRLNKPFPSLNLRKLL